MRKGWSETAISAAGVTHKINTTHVIVDNSEACTHRSLADQLHQSDVVPGSAPALGRHVQPHAVDECSVCCGTARRCLLGTGPDLSQTLD